MKNKSFFFLVIMTTYLLTTSSSGGGGGVVEKEYVSFPMMNAEIRHSMEENTRQQNIRNEQIVNSAAETINHGEWKKLQEVKTKIQDRLRFVDFALQAIPSGYSVYLSTEKIVATQKRILKEIQDAPYAVIPVIPFVYQLVDDMQMDIRLMVGIVASYGAINQLEPGDRQRLLNFALEEINQLEIDSTFILYKITSFKSKLRYNKDLMQYYFNRDKKVVESIMKRIKSFGN